MATGRGAVPDREPVEVEIQPDKTVTRTLLLVVLVEEQVEQEVDAIPGPEAADFNHDPSGGMIDTTSMS